MNDKLKKILIVDDDKINIFMMQNILKDDYEIYTATNGEFALDLIENNHINLILLDIVMPGLDGFKVAKILSMKEKTKNIPIIFVTGNDTKANIQEAFEIGGKDYIEKPIDKHKLKVRVKNQLKSIELEEDITKKQNFFEAVLNMQSNMILIVDSSLNSKNKVTFANKTFLNFLGFSTFQEYKDVNESLNDRFIKNDKLFYKEKFTSENYWLDTLISLNDSEKIVAFYSLDNKLKIFHTSAAKYEDKEYILSFTDITETMSSKFDLENKLNTDELTKAYSREYFNKNIELIRTQNKMNDKFTYLVFLDIDHFKDVNDNYGHDTGDKVLQQLVQCIKSNIRNEDIIVRWGGEEFILVVNIVNPDDIFKIIDSIREKVSSYSFDTVNHITSSFGVTLCEFDEDIETVIKRADKAMYQSKKNGRNQVSII